MGNLNGQLSSTSEPNIKEAQIFDELSNKVRKGEAVFLVGAGISVDPPSNLPTSLELMIRIIDMLVDKEHLQRELKTGFKDTRLEQFLTLIPAPLDKYALEELDAGQPNVNHYALARALSYGCIVLTTNFDSLIEKAAPNISFVYSHPNQLSELKKHGYSGSLIKLHGSLDLLVDGEPFVFSTIQAIIQGLPAETQTILADILETRPLIVCGYSGADDFDLYPWFTSHKMRNNLYWLRHSESDLRLRIPSLWPDDNATQVVKYQNGYAIEGKTRNLLKKLTGCQNVLSTDEKSKINKKRTVVEEEIRFLALGNLLKTVGLPEAALPYLERTAQIMGFKKDLDKEFFNADWLQIPEGTISPAKNGFFHPGYTAIRRAAEIYRDNGNFDLAWQFLASGLYKAKDNLNNKVNLPSIAYLLLDCARFGYMNATEHVQGYSSSFYLELALKVSNVSDEYSFVEPKIEALLLKCFWYRTHNSDTALKCVEEAIRIARLSPFRLRYYQARAAYGLYLMATNDYSGGATIFEEAIDFFKKCSDAQALVPVYGNLGLCYCHLGKADEAIKNLELQVQQSRILKSFPESALEWTFKRLAMLYWNSRRNRAKALEYISRTEKAIEENTSHFILEADVPTFERSWGYSAREAVNNDEDMEQ